MEHFILEITVWALSIGGGRGGRGGRGSVHYYGGHGHRGGGASDDTWLIPFVITCGVLWLLSQLDSPLTDDRYRYRTYFGIVGVVYALSWLCGLTFHSCLHGVGAFGLFAAIHYFATHNKTWSGE